MLIVLSPAKTLNEEPLDKNLSYTSTRLDQKSNQLAGRLRSHTKKSLKELMKISDSLISLNYDRYKIIDFPVTQQTGKAAIYLFNGDVYRGVDANTLNLEGIEYAQDHVRILSGLYGIIRPLDLIQPYRLEMGTSLKIRKHNNLYEFWGDDITNIINEDLKELDEKVVINLASNEYFKAIKTDILDAPVIDIVFREMRDGELKFIAFNAKVARGLMTRYAIDHSIVHSEELKQFDYEGYEYDKSKSSDKEWWFIKK